MLSLLSLAVATGLAAVQVQAHTYLCSPPSRLNEKFGLPESCADGSGHNELLCHYGSGNPTCCSSQAMKKQSVYKRGDEIETSWFRNNHVGGFIRYSIVPQDQSDSQEAFDAAENMLSYECNQVGCKATYGGSSPNNWNGGDSNGSAGWSNACSGGFKIPFHLKDGKYTVQWIWFGQGNGNEANSPFQACIDLEISGGPTGAPLKCPLWKGGDLSEAGDNVCSYVAVSNPTFQGVCKDANACKGRYAVGIPEGLQQCIDGQSPKTFPLAMVESSQGAPNTYLSYSADGSSIDESSSKSTSKSSSNSSLTNGSSGSSSSSKKKCSNKKRRSIKVASKTKRMHYGRRSPTLKHGAHKRKSGF